MSEGIIGLFDILGYKNFLENNEVGKITDEVLNILLNIPKYVKKQMGSEDQMLVRFMHPSETIKWHIFSDTIFIYTTASEYTDWFEFLNLVIILQRKMFEAGLPLRGVINTGQFQIKENCFAGKAISDAYVLGKNLDIAACILSDEAYKELKTTFGKKPDTWVEPFINHCFLVEYLIPLKNGKSEKKQTINFIYQYKQEQEIIIDAKEYVLNSFWKHKKTIPNEVQSKVNNTELFIRYIQYLKADVIDIIKVLKKYKKRG